MIEMKVLDVSKIYIVCPALNFCTIKKEFLSKRNSADNIHCRMPIPNLIEILIEI
jgi:hypothetical protein